MSAVPSLLLSSGYKIPQLGLGVLEISSEKMADAIDAAIATGYRLIDTAAVYGNEKELGKELAKSMKKYGVKREELFITTKLWCDKHAPGDVRKACEESLSKLGLDYVDLYLIHFPVSFQLREGYEMNLKDPSCLAYENIPVEETWKAMEELVPAGLAKSIGISNFNRSQIERILKICKIPPAVNQIEVNVHWPNTKMINYCHSKNIQVEGYSPFRNPNFLVRMGTVERPLVQEPNVIEVAKKYNKTPAQILIRLGLQQGIILIPKSATPERIKSNFEVMDFELNEADIEKLNKICLNRRLDPLLAFSQHPEYPFNEEC